MFDSDDAAFAIDAVRRATQLAQLVQREMVTPALTKSDRSPVTVADYAVQALVGKLLGEHFPGVPLVGEEDAAELRSADARPVLEQVTSFMRRIDSTATADDVCRWIDHGGGEPGNRFWTLDPIDGTKGFLRGEQYAVALALLVDGKVTLGVLGCPNLLDASVEEKGGAGSLVVAERGKGTWTATVEATNAGFKQLHVSDRRDITTARALRSVESGHTNVDTMGDLMRALNVQAEPVLMDSQAKYAVLAAGQGDLLFRLISAGKPDYKEKIWDQAAGSLIVEEAGGRITDLGGKSLDFTKGRTLASNRGIAASNGALHTEALAALQKLGA